MALSFSVAVRTARAQAIITAAATLMDIPYKNASTVATILGFLLGTAVASIFNFFLGSSKGNQTKDATIQALAGSK